MKLFFCGDFTSQTGPGTANRNLKDGFCRIQSPGYKFIFSMAGTKLKRMCELRHIVGCKAVILCSASQINKYAVWCAKLLHVKVVYLAHGLATMEQGFYGKNTSVAQKYENFIFSRADRIVAVSEIFACLVKQKYVQYADKVTYCYNSVQDSLIEEKIHEKKTAVNRIISVGGAMVQKCMLPVCEAVELINKREGKNLECIIVGKNKDQIEEISRISCVTYVEELSHGELLRLFSEGGIYVQNSLFETFGLAVVEALSRGCDLLISSHAGVAELFEGIRDEDVIRDNKNVDEISYKIERLLEKGNWEYLDRHFDWERVRTTAMAERMMEIIQGMEIWKEETTDADNRNDTRI